MDVGSAGASDNDVNHSCFAFCRGYIEKVEAVCKRYRVSANAWMGMTCEIIAAGFILEATQTDYAQLDEKLSHQDAMAYMMAKGALAHLKERGVNKSNVKEYMDNRVREFEEAARERGEPRHRRH